MKTTLLYCKEHGLLKKLAPRKTAFAFFMLLHLSVVVHAASPLKPDALTTEYLVNPLGLDLAAPRLAGPWLRRHAHKCKLLMS
jgi:hypothetical protein